MNPCMSARLNIKLMVKQDFFHWSVALSSKMRFTSEPKSISDLWSLPADILLDTSSAVVIDDHSLSKIFLLLCQLVCDNCNDGPTVSRSGASLRSRKSWQATSLGPGRDRRVLGHPAQKLSVWSSRPPLCRSRTSGEPSLIASSERDRASNGATCNSCSPLISSPGAELHARGRMRSSRSLSRRAIRLRHSPRIRAQPPDL